MQVLVWIIVGVALLVFSIAFWFGYGVLSVIVFYSRLEPLRWYTLDEVLTWGYGRYWTTATLAKFYQQDVIDIRLHGDLTSEQKLLVNKKGFSHSTVQFHDFRRSVNSSRKKPKWLNKPKLLWEPAMA